MQYSQSQLLRLKSIIKPDGPIPVSKSTLYAWIQSKRFPAPLKLGSVSVWRGEDIRKLIEEGVPRSGLATRSGGKS
jgi:predicted DNA-binding transcriptional regulator AlpA